MKNYYALVVDGRIKNFDDIYEGAVPGVIGNKTKLSEELSEICDINEWRRDEKSIIGKSVSTELKISFIPDQDGSVRMLNIENIEEEKLDLICSQYKLSTLN